MLDYVEYLADLLIAAELEQRVKIVEMLNKDGLIAGLEERLKSCLLYTSCRSMECSADESSLICFAMLSGGFCKYKLSMSKRKIKLTKLSIRLSVNAG